MNPDIDPIPNGKIDYDQLLAFVDAFPALLWRIDLVNNKIEYLNKYRLNALEANSGLLLQSVDYRRRFVMDEDLYRLDDFMASVRAGETAATIFRLKPMDNVIQWIKVTGVADIKNPRYYYGYMLDVTDTAGIVRSISENDAEMEAMIELVDHPALLLDPHTKTVMAHNAASRDLFLYKPAQFSRLRFGDLYHKSIESHISRIYEEAIFEKKWEGRLLFLRKNRSAFAGDVTIRPYYFKGHRVLRVSIHHVSTDDEALKNIVASRPAGRGADDPLRAQINALVSKVGHTNDIEEVLQILLDNQSEHRRFDSIIYSDIYATRKKVAVYTAGKAFESLPQGEIFPYEGTIAENIDRFKLEHLIVEDTFASIKAIDWALFVPYGIRSYFAKAFYERKVMRSVLILCSMDRNHFSTDQLHLYALYYEPFLQGLKNWRVRQKAKKKQG